MTTWNHGRELLNKSLARSLVTVEKFLEECRRRKPLTVPGTAIYLSMTPAVIPPALRHNLDHNKVLHERVCLLTAITEETAVWNGERVDVEKLDERFFQILIHYGYMEDPDVPPVLAAVSVPGLSFSPDSTSYFLGKESIIPTRKKRGMALWREKLFAFLSRNAFSAMSAFCLPAEQSVELRGQVEL